MPVRDDHTPIVVLRSNDICFLGILRSCAAAGIPTIPVTFDWSSSGRWYSEYSRHFKNPYIIANPFEYTKEAATQLYNIGKELYQKYDQKLFIVPSSDTNLMFLLNHAYALSDFFRFMGDQSFNLPRRDVVDKEMTYLTMIEHSVPAPFSIACQNLSEIDKLCKAMRFPCLFKPITKDYGQSFYRAHGGMKAVPCDNPQELEIALRVEVDNGFQVLVQERIEFSSVVDEIPFYLYADQVGNIHLAATAIKEIIHPYPYGTATVLRLSYHPELLALAEKVISAFRWRGFLMIEFIRDRRDGKWKVIELNGRPWLFIDFFRRSGFNFFQFLVDDLRGDLPCSPREVLVPKFDGVENDPLHIDFAVVFEDAIESGTVLPSLPSIKCWFSQFKGRISFPYLDPEDPDPGEVQLRQLAMKHGLEYQPLMEYLQQELSDQ